MGGTLPAHRSSRWQHALQAVQQLCLQREDIEQTRSGCTPATVLLLPVMLPTMISLGAPAPLEEDVCSLPATEGRQKLLT